MKVQLGPFGNAIMEALVAGDRAAAVGAALRRYAWAAEAGLQPVAFPRFRTRLDGECVAGEIEATVDEHAERTLEREARRHGVSMAQLLEHAVMVHLAQLDAASGAPALAAGGGQL